MDLTAVLTPLVNEAVRNFGPWAIVPVLAGAAVYEIRRKMIAKDEEIGALRLHIRDLQDKRLQDAREMIRIVEAGAAATKTRTESDQRFADLIEAFLHRQAGGWFGRRR